MRNHRGRDRAGSQASGTKHLDGPGEVSRAGSQDESAGSPDADGRADASAPVGAISFSPGGGRNGARAPHRSGRGAPDGRSPAEGLPTYGALDLGTNNCRLLIARPSRRGFLVIDAFSRIIRLGEGVTSTGRLSEAAMGRTIEALKVCSGKLQRQRVGRARLIATEACRIAENGSHFMERVRDEVGLDIEIVDRETEARLAVAGCASLIDRESELVLVFDIGGGSSELIWLDLSGRRHTWRRSLADRLEAQNCIVAWTSLPVGVVTLAERFGGRHVELADFEAMVGYVSALLTEFERRHPFRERARRSGAHLLGTSGTVTTVAGIHLGLPRYDRNRVDGCWLEAEDVRRVTAQLLALGYEGRVREPCIGQERADLVLAGCAILEAMLRMWPTEQLRVADRGLREGILATLMAEDGVFRSGRRGAGPNGNGRGPMEPRRR